ncbi:SAGA-associated factor 11 homolog isoform X2 [Agrilus planipennis]|uniref:SAGA-associated factor 11 n=1 Tax=Agrilus planipennis TaxID=224129 RepID=A0A1W4WT01_AGRPL|nr:SAGA-associated factor 11 homolog isoform X2 [Agrilus planipennis]
MENLGKVERHEEHESPKMKTSTLDRELHEVVSNKEMLSRAVEMFFDNIIDKILLGIVFDMHRKYKTNSFDPISEEIPPEIPEEALYTDIFGPLKKKVPNCLCPNCDRLVGAGRFAPHLEGCMGMKESRTATRRIASNNSVNSSKEKKNENTANYGSTASDDEYNSDWDWGDKRRKKKYKNGNKKKSNVKKTAESETVEAMNIDVEGEDDYLSNLRDLLQDSSNNSSPSDSPVSKKKEKSAKNKKGIRKDRASPNTSFNVD